MRTLPTLALSVLVAAALTGCLDTTPHPPATPSPTPLFASEDEALAAATAAYEEYLNVSDLVASEGGRNAERLAGLVTPKWLEKELNAFSEFLRTGNRIEGRSSLESSELRDYSDKSIALYVCTNYSHSRLLDANGNDVTPPSRPPLVGSIASFSISDGQYPLLSQIAPSPTDDSC